MSTHITGGGEVRILKEDLVKAVCALTGWSPSDFDGDGLEEWSTGSKTAAEELAQLIGYQGFDPDDIVEAPDGSVRFGHIEGYMPHTTKGFLEKLAPFVRPGGHLHCQSEYDEHWRWVFDGHAMARDEEAGTIWASETRAVREAALEAVRAHADMESPDATDNEIAALSSALDLALKALGIPELDDLAKEA